MRRLLPAVGAALLMLPGCAGEDEQQTVAPRTQPVEKKVVAPLPTFESYKPVAAEGYPNAKRIAGATAQRLLSYQMGERPEEIASRFGLASQTSDGLARAVSPAVYADAASAAEVVYVQLAGVTPTTLGAMVIVRQLLQDKAGERRTVTRTVDVRLVRSDASWTPAQVVSVGGSEIPKPAVLPRAASQVLNSPNLTLPDSARWDIYRGDVDQALLEALAGVGKRHRLDVSVLESGHPRYVWNTNRRSAHSSGYAVDIYSVDGELVVNQRVQTGPAYALSRGAIRGGAWQIGSPWDFDGGGRRSFTDVVHHDHIHLQQRPIVGAPRGVTERPAGA